MATARNFTSTAVTTFITGTISNSATTFAVGALVGYPAVPFTAVLEAGTANEEVIEVTNTAGVNVTATRGVDGTTAVSHNINASFSHSASARDFNDANAHILNSAIHVGSKNVAAANITDGTITGSLFPSGTLTIPSTTITASSAGLSVATASVTGAGTALTVTNTLSASTLISNQATLGIGRATGFTSVLPVADAFVALSGVANGMTDYAIGRTTPEGRLGITATPNQFLTGTAAGDLAIKADSTANKIYLGSGSGTASLVVSNTGLTAPQTLTVSGQTTASNGLSVTGTLVLPNQSVTGTMVAFDTITGAGGSGAGNIAASTIQGYNVLDGSLPFSKLSTPAQSQITAIATGDSPFGFLRRVSATGTSLDANGKETDGFSINNGATRVSDGLAYAGFAISTSGVATGSNLAVSGPSYAALVPGQYQATFYVRTSSSATGSNVATITVSGTAVTGSSTTLTGNMVTSSYQGFVIPFTVTSTTNNVNTQVTSLIAGSTFTTLFSHVRVQPLTGQVTQGIVDSFFANASITSAKINTLTADKIIAGTITSDDIFIGAGGHLYSGTKGGASVELNSTGLYGYNSGATPTFQLLNTGALTLTGTINATGGNFTGTVQGGTFNASVFRTGSSNPRVVFDSTGVKGFNSGGTNTIALNSDGSVSTSSGNFAIDTSGNITANGSIVVNNTLSAQSLKTSTLTAGALISVGSTPRIELSGAGTLKIFNSSNVAVLSEDASGNLVMTGSITANGADFGSSTISGGTFTGSTFQTNSGNTSAVRMDSTGIKGWNASSVNTFSLTTAGALTSTSGLIAGWVISPTNLSTPGVLLDAATPSVSVGTGASLVKMQSAIGLWAGKANSSTAGPPTGFAASFSSTGGTFVSGSSFRYFSSTLVSTKESGASSPIFGNFPGAVTTMSTPTVLAVDDNSAFNGNPGLLGSWTTGTYYFVTTAVGLGGESLPSAQASVALSSVTGTYPLIVFAQQAKAASYRIYYGTTSGGPYNKFIDLGANYGGTYGRSYYYANSGPGSFASGSPPGSNTSANTTAGSLTLSWTLAPGATHTYIYKLANNETGVGPNPHVPGGWHKGTVTAPTATFVDTNNPASFGNNFTLTSIDQTGPPFFVTVDGAFTSNNGTVQGLFKSSVSGPRVEIGPYYNGDAVQFLTGDPFEYQPGTIRAVFLGATPSWLGDQGELRINSPSLDSGYLNNSWAQIRLLSKSRDSTSGSSIFMTADTVDLSAATSLIAGGGDIVGAWISYTPSLTGATTNPTNYTGTGRYKQVGKTVHVSIDIAMGAGYTVGSGLYSISLPVTPRSGTPNMQISGSMQAVGANRQTLAGNVDSATTSLNRLWNGQATTGTTGLGGGSFAWANGDFLRLTGTYEAA